jgi:benzylsuccinate CoA-transferase BbsF subunit
VAVAAWSDDEWEQLADVIRVPAGPGRAELATLAQRQARIDEVEALVAGWTSQRSRDEVVAKLQALGLEAVAVADFGDVFADPQLAHRGHFVTLEHPFLGEGRYERNGFRLSGAPSGYRRPGPTIGEDNQAVLGGVLGMSDADIEALVEQGALE